MGRQRKKRGLKSKKSDTEEGAYESGSILNTGVASTSTIDVSSKSETLKDVYKIQTESTINTGDLRAILSSRIQPSTSKAESSIEGHKDEPMDTSLLEKLPGAATYEHRLHRTSLKVHISRCIRRRTWREPKEFRPSPEELLITYGINAYQYWARNKNKDITKGSKRVKEDLLAVPLHQWNKILSSFIQTMTDPNGRALSGGAILYIVLGRSLSLIEEGTLWLAGQLGSHSPVVLLMSIIYFNTKYFKLRTVKSHSNLCFKNILICNISTAAGKKSCTLSYQPGEVIDITEEENKMETEENKDNSMVYDQLSLEDATRCPVELYKFYISKCPKSARGKDDKVYLSPIQDCSPDAESWFSSEALPEVKIFRMLQTFRYVQESIVQSSDMISIWKAASNGRSWLTLTVDM